MDRDNTFGTKLQGLREGKGLTQNQLAKLVGLPVGTVRNHEQNIREPSASTLYEYAKALGEDCTVFARCTFAFKKRPAGKKSK